jgi:hypothetical protein
MPLVGDLRVIRGFAERGRLASDPEVRGDVVARE